MASPEIPRVLWRHSHPERTQMHRFMREVNSRHKLQIKTYHELYTWSVQHRSAFYALFFDWACIIHTGRYTRVVDESLPITSVPRWFSGVFLNFAENILFSRARTDPTNYHGMEGKEDDKIAVTEVREGNSSVRHVTWRDLRARAGRLASAMEARGVLKGDRIVLVGANSIETLLVFLAATWLGALFSSSSTDMGVSGILQRTVQVSPKFIFFDDGALYNGKIVDLREKMAGVAEGMKDCPQFQGLVTIQRFSRPYDTQHIPRTESFGNFLKAARQSPPDFVRIAFHEPFLIYYSSGTTGIPKVIVHSAGGVIVSMLKEGRLHEDRDSNSVGFQYTTTGWIMYIANAGQLLFGARAVMYDGSPFQPDLTTYIKIMAEHKVDKFGTSPRWLFEMAKNGISPRDVADLSNLQIVTTTGMVLSDQLFEWFYEKGFPKHVRLANISGGTDIAGCFGVCNPLSPIYLGGTQGQSLGVQIAIYDSTLPDGPGRPVPDGTPGELVATSAFPNMPCFLWPHTSHPVAGPGTKYHAAYFSRFDGVWAHGDFCAVHPVTHNVAFLGRADGVLNPSGVRFGSAEIYAVVEKGFAEQVADSLCVGQRRPGDADESVMLFLLMRPGVKFTESLAREVKGRIAKELTKRHVPRYVFETPAIPTTVNLKKVELPVKRIVSGEKITPSGTLLNPESLAYYYRFAKVEELAGVKGKL